MAIVMQIARKDVVAMAERTWMDKTLHIWRLRLIGFGMGLFGISIMLTPPGVFGVTTYIQQTLGLHPYIQGVWMVLGGAIILLFKPRLQLYLVCILPMLLYCVGALLYAANGSSWTPFVGYCMAYGFMFLEGSYQA